MNNGGPAFPIADSGHGYAFVEGMSMRDYFAAKAMQSLMISDPEFSADETAELAYCYATEMLKARFM
jgi:hypothetical protein